MSKTKWHSAVIHLTISLALVLSFTLVTAVSALAAPVVSSVTETTFGGDTTNHSVNMPATVNTGDLLIVLFTNDGSATVTTPGGWTLMASTANGSAVRLSVYYKIAAGTEGGTQVNFVTSAGEQAAAQVYRITNWHGTIPPEISTATTGFNTSPDPSSLNPAGWDVVDTLWLAVAGQDRGSQLGTTAYPASYTDGISTLSSTGLGNCRTLSARRVLAAASEDPGTFTIPASEQWVAFTIAVRPMPHDLTISSTYGGSVITPGEGVFTYEEGTVVDLVAEAEEGYRFDEWTGNVSTIADVYAASTNITMNGDYFITANFLAVYNLTMAADPDVGGTATDLTNESPYTEGTEVNIKAEANEGYEFLNWTAPTGVFGNVTATETTFTMPAQNVTVTANFEEVPPVYPTVTTQDATDVSTDSATLNMDYTVGDFSPVEVRFTYKKSADPAWSYTAWVSKTSDGTHAESLTELNSNTDYEFIAQLKYNDTMEGTTLQFTTDKPSTPPPSGGCFIATAAYGTPMAEEIQILREFRDEYLLTNPIGQALVDLYYMVSPPIAEFITEHPSLKPIVRAGLLPAVAMSTIAVNATMPDKAVLLSLLVLALVMALATWATRRRGRGPQYT